MSDSKSTLANLTFPKAKAESQRLWDTHKAATDKLLEVSGSKGVLGLVPDSVKGTRAWKDARLAERSAFLELREFNKWYVKTFKRELAEDRRLNRPFEKYEPISTAPRDGSLVVLICQPQLNFGEHLMGWSESNQRWEGMIPTAMGWRATWWDTDKPQPTHWRPNE